MDSPAGFPQRLRGHQAGLIIADQTDAKSGRVIVHAHAGLHQKQLHIESGDGLAMGPQEVDGHSSAGLRLPGKSEDARNLGGHTAIVEVLQGLLQSGDFQPLVHHIQG